MFHRGLFVLQMNIRWMIMPSENHTKKNWQWKTFSSKISSWITFIPLNSSIDYTLNMQSQMIFRLMWNSKFSIPGKHLRFCIVRVEKKMKMENTHKLQQLVCLNHDQVVVLAKFQLIGFIKIKYDCHSITHFHLSCIWINENSIWNSFHNWKIESEPFLFPNRIPHKRCMNQNVYVPLYGLRKVLGYKV